MGFSRKKAYVSDNIRQAVVPGASDDCFLSTVGWYLPKQESVLQPILLCQNVQMLEDSPIW